MYSNITASIQDIPLRLDLESMQILEETLGVNWQKDLLTYDYDKLTIVFYILMKEGQRYYSYKGKTLNYTEITEETTYFVISKYKRKELYRFLIDFFQQCLLTEEDIKRIESEQDMELYRIKKVRGNESEENKKTNFARYYYIAQSKFNLSMTEASFLLLVDWKALYKEYKDNFDRELCLTLTGKTYSQLEKENNFVN